MCVADGLLRARFVKCRGLPDDFDAAHHLLDDILDDTFGYRTRATATTAPWQRLDILNGFRAVVIKVGDYEVFRVVFHSCGVFQGFTTGGRGFGFLNGNVCG